MAQWALPEMYAGVQGRGAQDAWYTTALDLEEAFMNAQPVTGGAVDIHKCFDQILRPVVYKLSAMAGVPGPRALAPRAPSCRIREPLKPTSRVHSFNLVPVCFFRFVLSCAIRWYSSIAGAKRTHDVVMLNSKLEYVSQTSPAADGSSLDIAPCETAAGREV